MKRLTIFAAGALAAASVLADNAPEPRAASVVVSSSSDEFKFNVDLKVGSDVQNHEVVGESSTFDASADKIVAWTRVTGASQPTQITHVWKRNGVEVSRVPLNIHSALYRTFSRCVVTGLPGNWSVEVLDGMGRKVASKEFTVTGSAVAAPPVPAKK